MRIVTLSEKADLHWNKLPFNPSPLDNRYLPALSENDRKAILSVSPELEEFLNLPEGTKLEVQTASYTNTDGCPCGNPHEQALEYGHIYPHIYQVHGYLEGTGFVEGYEHPLLDGTSYKFPARLGFTLQRVDGDGGSDMYEIYPREAIIDPNDFLKIPSQSRDEQGFLIHTVLFHWHPVKISHFDSGKVMYHNQTLEEQMEMFDKELEKRAGQDGIRPS